MHFSRRAGTKPDAIRATNTGVSEISHVYDGQAHLVSEEVRLGANAGSLAAVTKLVNHYDAAGRRDNLGKDATIPSLGSAVGGNWGFGYRANGQLTSVSSAGASFNYSYGDNGLLQTRSNAFRNYTVPTSGGRDNRARAICPRAICPSSVRPFVKKDLRFFHQSLTSHSCASLVSKLLLIGHTPITIASRASWIVGSHWGRRRNSSSFSSCVCMRSSVRFGSSLIA
ncbi:hypothetical protein BH11VER1_BH11VER1_29010 [soil metagenome]